ncbi:MAG: hypothetical protein CM1200mP41_32980 [Gammaproteobacteria bacterium]|nr:MAG: hypothetical protein CM1200mP41_32980 [Gammaproteobacteria bacterium]
MVAVSIANHQIHDLVKTEADLDGMGLPLSRATSVMRPSRCPSRRFATVSTTDGILTQLTVDQPSPNGVSNSVKLRNQKSALSGWQFSPKSLGTDLAIEPDVLEIEPQQGDLYLLCSDGLSDMVAPDAITTTLTEHSANLETALQALIDQANANGGRDNIAVALARYPST